MKRQRTSPPPAEAKAPTAPPHVPPPEVAAEGGSPEVAAEFVGDDSPQAAAAGIDSPQEEVVHLPKTHGVSINDEEDLFGRRLATSATVE